MMIDSEDRQWFYKDATFKNSFALLPKRCDLSKKLIWLKTGIKATKKVNRPNFGGPTPPLYFYKWHDKNEHLIWLLKGKK
jgi:hypothetical protein